MAYGDNSTAYKLLAQGKTREQLISLADKFNIYTDAVTYIDGSFIELRKFNNHQAFLANGQNVTPR